MIIDVALELAERQRLEAASDPRQAQAPAPADTAGGPRC